jgi:hypothetical protein
MGAINSQGPERLLARTVTVVLPVLFVMVAVVWIVVGASLGVRGLMTYRWPTATGQVTEQRLGTRFDDSSGPTIRYTFEVGGQTYVGEGIQFGAWGGMRTRVVREHPVGTGVTVRYNPSDPSQAVLIAGPSANVLVFFAAAALFAGGAVGIRFIAPRIRWHTAPQA